MRKFIVLLLFVCFTCIVVAGATPDIEGHWALLEIASDYWHVPLAGERQRTGIIVGSVTIEQDGVRFVMKDLIICKMLLNTGTEIVKVEIPESFFSSITMGSIPGRIYKEGDRHLVEVPWFVLVNGARLSDPEDDLLPTTADDPRVYDQDRDDHPGVTTRISIVGLISGEAYVVQRVRKSYKGSIETDDRMHGLLFWEDEQNTLSASSSLFSLEDQGRPDPEIEHSYFTMIRINGDESCDEIVGLFAEQLEDLI
jgi:hypothetical protein